jgi:hypothetical protein
MKLPVTCCLLTVAVSCPVLAADVPLWLAESKLDIKVQSCEDIVRDYQRSCLKSCESYKETRKTQCEAACNDSEQLRLRRLQCEAGRKT